jgi:hypothetical protein
VGGGVVRPIVVRGEPGLRGMVAYLLSGRRRRPVVALTRSLSTGEPVLMASAVRAVVGPGSRIYYVSREHLLRGLREVLGRRLALPAGGVRVWWPGLSVGSDPSEHPFALELDGESARDMLGEFAREFELSRPRVRQEVAVIEEVRRLVEGQLAQARRQNRDVEIERDEALTRAETAEASLKIATERLQKLGARDDRGSS